MGKKLQAPTELQAILRKYLTLSYCFDNDTVSQSYNFKVDPSFPCPLLSKRAKKENLVLFIIKKSKECLNETRDPFRVEAFFFWQIIKLFCRQNGKVMLCEVASLLLRNYNMLRKKLRHTDTYKAWCLPLVRLLCLNVSDDEHKEAVIKMGDDFDSRGLTYAAHICYMVVKVELGFRGQFYLIGCDSTTFPFGVKVLKEAIMRTETYEYVLSLTSGLAQPSFQIFKLCNTSRLTLIELYDIALEYCETISRVVRSFPGSFTRSFLKRVIVLSCNLQKKLQQEQEPEWLLDLRQLHADKSAAAIVNSVAEPEQNVPSASSDPVSEVRHMRTMSYCQPVSLPDLGMYMDPEELLNSRYTLGDLLGKGGFGAVFEGVRCEDGKQVAIKYVNKNRYNPLFHIPEDSSNLPAEVVLMKMVSQPPCCSNIVELLEWFDLPYQFVMILERPSPCLDLDQFARLQNGRLTEAQTQGIMLQVIRAAHHCCERGVLHRDIKAQNLLINTDTMQVKLIDFGCGEVLKDTTYVQYSGTPAFRPPEWVMFKQYNGIPATVWGLGILMYNLLYGEYPFKAEHYIDVGHLKLVSGVSQDCFDLMMWCLELNPELRPTFEDLFQHEWFIDTVQDKV